jgi:hypothetical protein
VAVEEWQRGGVYAPTPVASKTSNVSTTKSEHARDAMDAKRGADGRIS